MQKVYADIVKAKSSGEKRFAVLIDPDHHSEQSTSLLVKKAVDCGVDYFFVGGSLLADDRMENCISCIRAHSSLPIVLFPGSTLQVTSSADAVLFLSLISGRNADLLIGRHVEAAPYIKKAGLEAISTGYMIVDSGRPTTASYMSNAAPIPYDKPEIAACTAMAGEMLGLQQIFLDGGSGAKEPVSEKMIALTRRSVDVPIIVGGGMRTAADVASRCQAGADVVVVGNIFEQYPERLAEMVAAAKATEQVKA